MPSNASAETGDIPIKLHIKEMTMTIETDLLIVLFIVLPPEKYSLHYETTRKYSVPITGH